MNEKPDTTLQAGSNLEPLSGAKGSHAGAWAGQGVANAVNPTVEDAYWRENFAKREYVERDRPYADYGPAYRYGWEAHARSAHRPFHEVERELELGWAKAKGESKLAWEQAKHATSDAWHRIERAGRAAAPAARS
jgi:hypothetical protein